MPSLSRSAERAVILAAGRGTRMRRHDEEPSLDAAQRAWAERGIKALVPFHGHAYLSYVLTALADAGILEVCLVVGSGDDPIRAHYEAIPTSRLRIAFATQERPLGTAHALLAAEAQSRGDPFLVINSDNVYPPAAVERVRTIPAMGLAGFRADALVQGGIPAERVADFALLELDEHGFLARVAEKPGAAAAARLAGDALVSMTCWRFEPPIFDACRAVAPSVRGELELPDAVSIALANGVRFHVLPTSEPVIDLTSRADVPRVARQLSGIEVRL